MKKSIAAVAVVLSAVSLSVLSGCWSGGGAEGAFLFATQGKEAMVYSYQWDGDTENMTIVIPETYQGSYTVTTVGGYYGRGYPCPFTIFLPEEIGITYTMSGDDDLDARVADGRFESYTVVNYDFTLQIGANIESVDYVNQCAFVCEDGGQATVYYPRVYIECAPENEHYYSENGILYAKDGAKVEGFLYVE